jgi:hypothetical protein
MRQPCQHCQSKAGGHGATHWLFQNIVKHVRGNVDGLTLNLVGPASVVSQATNYGAHITTRQQHRLAIVEGLHGGEPFGILLNNVGELEHQSAALLRGDCPPLALERLPRGSDGDVDILLGGLVHGADNLLGGRVDDLKGLLVGALDELVVDESVGGEGQDQRRRLGGGGYRSTAGRISHLQSGGLLVCARNWRLELCEDV